MTINILTWLRTRNQKSLKNMVILSLGTIIAIELVFTWITNSYMKETGYDIMSFEFTYSVVEMTKLLETWKPIMPFVWLFFGFDFVFPISYAMFLSITPLYLYKKIQDLILNEEHLHTDTHTQDQKQVITPWNHRILSSSHVFWVFAFFAAWIAAISDYLENIISLVILATPSSFTGSELFFLKIFVTTKFTLIFVASIFLILQVLLFGFTKVLTKQTRRIE